jgi:hypothetical protein
MLRKSKWVEEDNLVDMKYRGKRAEWKHITTTAFLNTPECSNTYTAIMQVSLT